MLFLTCHRFVQLPPNLIQWRTKEELAQEREKQMLDPDMEYIPMSESVLVLPKNYVEMVSRCLLLACCVMCALWLTAAFGLCCVYWRRRHTR